MSFYEQDFKHYMDLEVTKEDTERMAIVTSAKINSIRLNDIVEYIYERLDPRNNLREPTVRLAFDALPTETKQKLATSMFIYRYCIHRILTFYGVYKADNWQYHLTDDYYAQDVQSIKLNPNLAEEVDKCLRKMITLRNNRKIEKMILRKKNPTMAHSIRQHEFGELGTEFKEHIYPKVISTFKAKYPLVMTQIVEPYLEKMLSQQDLRHYNFSLLIGETQSGKTIAMHLLSWILIYGDYGYTPCYITKKISALRDDAMDKLKYGAVNTIVKDVLDKLGLVNDCSISGGLGIKVDTKSITKRGLIPVFLMEPANSKKALGWMKNLLEATGKSYPVFFFDEVQDLYATKSYLKDRGFRKSSLDKGNIGNHMLIHMIAKQCRKYQCAMIGITATPQRCMSSDPEVYPNHTYRMPCAPPVEGLKRIGYDGSDNEEFLNADFSAETDVIVIIQEILDREQVTLTTGNKQIKFLNIVTDCFNDDMSAIHDTIIENYHEQVYVKLFIQDKAEYGDINSKSLDDFFDLRDVPEQVIQNGVMVLIGKAREAAGITIKPSFKLVETGHHQSEIDGETYIINGMTDICIKLPDNMETAEQLIGRASGWYDEYHEMYIWLPQKQLHDAKSGLIRTKNSMITQYDTSKGPASLIEVSNHCTSISKFTTNDNYRANHQRKGNLTVTSDQSQPDCPRLGTSTMRLPNALYTKFKEAQAEPGGGGSPPGRALLKKVKAAARNLIGRDIHTQIAWTDNRYKEIIKGVAQPRGMDSQWKVNAYSYETEDGYGLQLVCFDNTYDDRPRFGYKCTGCQEGTCHEHCSIDTNLCWHDGIQYQIAGFTRQMTHKCADALLDWHHTVEHDHVMELLEKLVEECKTAIRKKNLYQVFVRLHTLQGLNKFRRREIHSSTWSSKLWKKFQENYCDLHTELKELLKESIDVDATLEEIKLRMADYFCDFVERHEPNPRIDLRPAPKPMVRVKIKIKARPKTNIVA